MFVTLNK